MGALQAWWDSSPDCVTHGQPPALPLSGVGTPDAPGIAKAFEECAGFFTWGPGRAWELGTGNVVEAGTAGTYTLTVIGFAIMLLAFIAWVMVEHRKLTSQAERLRAAGEIHVEPGPRPFG